jgi:uncharacterized membrane protein YgdD (TMEM256/DUF423 family)
MLILDRLDHYSWEWIANILIMAVGAVLVLWTIAKDHTSMSMVEEIRHDQKYLALGIILFAGGLMSLFPISAFSVLWVIDTLDG